jgi:hypothetical protein
MPGCDTRIRHPHIHPTYSAPTILTLLAPHKHVVRGILAMEGEGGGSGRAEEEGRDMCALLTGKGEDRSGQRWSGEWQVTARGTAATSVVGGTRMVKGAIDGCSSLLVFTLCWLVTRGVRQCKGPHAKQDARQAGVNLTQQIRRHA